MKALYLGLATEKNDSAPFLIENLIVLLPLLEVIMITFQYLHKHFLYEEHTGNFISKGGRKRVPDGKILGHKKNTGYIEITINRNPYLAHRLAFFYMKGRWPNQIDHINMDRSDNRWVNLRECTPSENSFNTHPPKNNKSGYKGVYYRKDRGAWIATITKNGKTKYLGYFKKKSDAVKAYSDAAKNEHKEFLNLNNPLEA